MVLNIAVSSDAPPGVVRWLETSGRFRDMQCEVRVRSASNSPGSLKSTVEMKVIFENADYWERSLNVAPELKIKSERSYVNGTSRSFRHWEETKIRGRVTPSEQGLFGIIDTTIEGQRPDAMYVGPSLGYHLTRNLGCWKSVGELIESCEIVAEASNSPEFEVYLFKDVCGFGANESSHYDIRVTLSSKYDFLAVRQEGLLQGVGQPAVTQYVTSFHDFKQVDGLWVPTLVLLGSSDVPARRVEIVPESIKLNSGLAPSELEAQFPKGTLYRDVRLKQMFVDGEPVKSKDDPSNATTSVREPTNLFGQSIVAAFLIGIVLIVVGVVIRKRHVFKMLLAILSTNFMITGCQPSSHKTDLKKAYGNVEVYPSSTMHVSARVDSERTIVKFELKNCGNKSIVLDSFVSASCGCTNASLTKTFLEAGEKCEVVAEVDVPKRSGRKVIQLGVRQLTPFAEEFTFLIDASFEGDWGMESDMLVFEGKPGETVLGSVKLFGEKEALSRIEIVDYDLFCSLVTDKLTDSSREIVFSRKLGSSVSENVLGDFRLEAPNLVPSECVIRASDIVKAPGKWSPRAISLKPGERKSSELMLDDGFELVSIAASEQLSIDRSKDSLTSGEIITVSLLEGADLQQEVVRLEALIGIEGEYLKLPLLVLIQKD